jgi:hypothetical protein
MEIFSLFGGIKTLIMGGLTALAALFALWFKAQASRMKKANAELQAANQMHQAIEKVHDQDQQLEVDTRKKIEEVHEKVKESEHPEQVVADELNKLFNPDK